MCRQLPSIQAWTELSRSAEISQASLPTARSSKWKTISVTSARFSASFPNTGRPVPLSRAPFSPLKSSGSCIILRLVPTAGVASGTGVGISLRTTMSSTAISSWSQPMNTPPDLCSFSASKLQGFSSARLAQPLNMQEISLTC